MILDLHSPDFPVPWELALHYLGTSFDVHKTKQWPRWINTETSTNAGSPQSWKSISPGQWPNPEIFDNVILNTYLFSYVEEFCLKLPSEPSKAYCYNISLTWKVLAPLMPDTLDTESLQKIFIPQSFAKYFICGTHCLGRGKMKVLREIIMAFALTELKVK